MRYWKIAPGEGGFAWVEQRDKGCIAVGWNDIGDLDKYPNDEAIKKKFYQLRKKIWGSKTAPYQLLTFYRKVEREDKIVASSGELLYGIGTVAGKRKNPYKFDAELLYKHSKPVNWETTFWEPLNVQKMRLPDSLKKRLNLNRTILELEEAEWKKIYHAVNRIKSPFKNLRNWEGLPRAPQTEQEVIILFSKLNNVLRIKIESVSTKFPDAAIQVKKWRRWVSKRAEFEKKSSDFKRHGHNPKDCDYLICWEDDEPPKGVKVIALRDVLEELL